MKMSRNSEAEINSIRDLGAVSSTTESITFLFMSYRDIYFMGREKMKKMILNKNKIILIAAN